MSFIRKVVGFLNDMETCFEAGKLVTLPRDASTQWLITFVENSPPQTLDAYEKAFLAAAGGMFGAPRERSVELYAFFKVLEFKRFGWRGFSDEK